ncbi:MAG: hypothetical protein KIT31_06285 [Deltaproteobacteria bacterium]|nr:hypothetical protein [Deltaproteobacteria bacterium]
MRELPLVSIGNVAVGVIAIGNVARGVVAIGLSASVGVVAIGLNAVGAVAIGLNTAGPVSIGAINSVGTVAVAGVNAIGGLGGAGVNAGFLPAIGLVLAAIALVVGQSGARRRLPRRRDTGDVSVAGLATCAPGDYRVLATAVVDPTATALAEGDARCVLDGTPDDLPANRAAYRVRVAERFAEDGGDYREAAVLHRRVILLGCDPIAHPPLIATAADLAWAIGRGLQVSAVASAIAVAAARYV